MSYRGQGRSLWELMVLCLLYEGPLHPYEMQRLIRQRRKDRLLDLRRGSLYNAVGQLRRAGLIEPTETVRDSPRPERTVYRLTESGAQEAHAWLVSLLEAPAPDTSRFIAAIGNVSRLEPDVVERALRARAEALEAELADLHPAVQEAAMEGNPVLRAIGPELAPVLFLDAAYLRTMRQAELEWVRTVIAELKRGRLSWSFDEIVRRARHAARELTLG
jgi:DNA-binding PadR family transcriptional regulator